MDRNNLLEKIKETVAIHKNLHLNDPAISKCWSTYEDLLSKDLPSTKWVLENIGEGNLYWVSESFDEISSRLQSREFVDFVKQLSDKYPEAQMKDDVEAAEQMLNDGKI